ncbi:sulfoacetaldehyde dehydrogenase [Thioalkalivibrio denitrificans]|uniref:Sulfoacetaldehyde dehydrogenase n=1 Tax=Thioalkalivibrio denitrificans TaxID=108003 RepID=A0A1V3NFH0_9GAMM|nr:aldehyde dehydrogenase family protein [Thioalkalivibrio denitrificans]OOG23847.1 sulfoacetaldehyde dehydrogenase [Thioalkalivibrio denitrificans]
MGSQQVEDQASDETAARVTGIVDRARAAQQVFERFDQARVDEAVTALAWALMHPKRNRELSELAVQVTGLGNVSDKIIKNERKTKGLLRDLNGQRTVGVIRELPELGLVEIARPVGVVGAVVPSTNPAATPTNKAINAVKCRNAVILSPSPKGAEVCARLVGYMHEELDRVGAPRDLVQFLPAPVSKEMTLELMRQVDLVLVTGSQNNVRSAYASGTPAIGVGTGNVPVIIDDSADLHDAAAKIARSKTFDNATSCSSENSLVIVDAVYDAMLEAMAGQGGVLLNAEEKALLQDNLWQQGSLNRRLLAKSAAEIARAVGIERADRDDTRILMVEESGAGPEYPFSSEKLSPVLTIYRVADFDAAFDKVHEILLHQGAGHSCGIHTRDDAHVMRLGLEMPVCRVIVNQAHAVATGGSFDNGLPFSLSMGCGTWGGNPISDNLNFRHYMNITRIARTIPPVEPSMEDLFGAYWKKHGLEPE